MPSILIVLFIISIFIPVEFHVMAGSLRIEPYRIVLLIALLYSLMNIRRLLEQADLVDILLFVLLGLTFISFAYNHSIQKALESTGIYAIETLGAFYLARLWIINPRRFYRVNLTFVVILGILFAFGVYESFAQHRILHEWATQLTGHESLDYRLNTHYYVRLGILRATNVFAHPILYGTIAALFFPFMVMLLRFSFRRRYLLGGVMLFSTMMLTLSSAPLLSLVFQGLSAVLVRFWNKAQHFWLAFAFVSIAAASFLQVFSNRGFLGILVSYLTFNPSTGYYRMLQWQYSMNDISNNLLFGIAHHDWHRPAWLSESIDSFWLLLVLQHGIIAGAVLFFIAFYSVFYFLNRLHLYHVYTRWMVSSWVLAFTAMILIGFTVDFYGKLQPMFFLFLGAIGWARYPDKVNQQLKTTITTSITKRTKGRSDESKIR
jgi:hypothetical protein